MTIFLKAPKGHIGEEPGLGKVINVPVFAKCKVLTYFMRSTTALS